MASTIPRPTAGVCSWELPAKHPPSLSPVFTSGGKRKDTNTTPTPRRILDSGPTLAAAMARSTPPGRQKFSGHCTMKSLGLIVTVSPPHRFRRPPNGDPIEHRLFKPDQQELDSRAPLQTVIEGPEVHPHHHSYHRLESDCSLDTTYYPIGVKVSKQDPRATFHQEETLKVLPKWNYTISPKM